MLYDLFISYPHRDNSSSRISEILERSKVGFEPFAGHPLHPFFYFVEMPGWEGRGLEQRCATYVSKPRHP